ncbi:MAG TPA: Ig-like domain-containing protein [Lutibacter sp.]
MKILKNLLSTLTIACVILMTSCATDEDTVGTTQSDVNLEAAGLAKTFPENLADTVAVNPLIVVNFKSTAIPSEVAASELSLKQGTVPVSGTVTFSGTTATFRPVGYLAPNTQFTATIKTNLKDGSSKDNEKEHSWTFRTGNHHHQKAFSVVSVTPLNSATGVAFDIHPTITFSEKMESKMIESVMFNLKKGTTEVEGSLTYSDKTATFIPTSNLETNTLYTGMITINANNDGENDDEDDDDHYYEDNDGDDNDDGDYNNDDGDDDDEQSSNTYIWSFTTGGDGVVADITAPTILSIDPANNAASIAVSSNITATFSEAMNTSTITTATFTLKQGTTNVAGTVSYSGNTATFNPTSDLTGGLVYTATITTGAKDVAGNEISVEKIWIFTTLLPNALDLTAPTILSIDPANNAASVAVSSNITATFSEAMNTSTITTATFTLKQGTTNVAGSVSYSGNTATFNPTSDLAGGLVYTATITTGAKDVAGNAIAVAKVWSFTTLAPVPAGLSFATDVMPTLAKCNNCHTHPWTTSTVASTYYTNLVNGGYVNPTNYTSSKIYSKLNGGHPGGTSISTAEINKILDWMKEGSKNN